MQSIRTIENALRLAGLAGLLMLLGCASGTRGTLVSYPVEHGKRLPAGEVAQIMIRDVHDFGSGLRLRLDAPEEIRPRDTLEILPGRHVLQLLITSPATGSPLAKRRLRYNPDPPCLHLSFAAEAGHQYELRIIDYTLSDWHAELVDLHDSAKVVHSGACPVGKWWLKSGDQWN